MAFCHRMTVAALAPCLLIVIAETASNGGAKLTSVPISLELQGPVKQVAKIIREDQEL